MQVRYQAALRPVRADYRQPLRRKKPADRQQLLTHLCRRERDAAFSRGEIRVAAIARRFELGLDLDACAPLMVKPWS